MTTSSVLTSTFVFTLLSLIGLVFFIRASVKDRTQTFQFIADSPEESLLNQLQEYFVQRAYKISSVDVDQQKINFQGLVRPSGFLAVFLTLLAILGIVCFILVLSFMYPSLSAGFWGLILLSPIAGIFYWQQAGRIEQISLKVEALPADQPETARLISVTGHRDELAELKRNFSLKGMSDSAH
ncbi:MAG: cofactor assembly of complex C subunit B [Snowella sp.]|nr:cofactor assembly of complex C subunit B [Snowella sp.]